MCRTSRDQAQARRFHSRNATITTEPISANSAQASRPYCRIATARRGASVADVMS